MSLTPGQDLAVILRGSATGGINISPEPHPNELFIDILKPLTQAAIMATLYDIDETEPLLYSTSTSITDVIPETLQPGNLRLFLSLLFDSVPGL
jgi:hypothetical protein